MRFVDRFSILERRQIVDTSQQSLWSDYGAIGLDYLMKTRKLSEKTIRSFSLGYIPSNINHQLQGRIILPIYDPSNNLIAVSSRRIGEGGADRLSVYWHESYEKSFYLYGITQAEAGMHRWKFAIVSEGQFDVMQLHNHGIDNAVGLCGNKMSNVHLSVIYRTCKDIVLLLDNDSLKNRAGQAASERIQENVDTSYKEYQSIRLSTEGQGLTDIGPHHRITIATLPEEKSDPDSFVCKHGADLLKSIVRDKLVEMRNRYVF